MCCHSYITNVVHKDNEKKVVEAGALECIVAAMRNHSTSADVQEKACVALWNISCFAGMCRMNICENINVAWLY